MSTTPAPPDNLGDAAQWMRPEELHPHPENPRINDHAVPGVAASIKRHGWGAPIIARTEDMTLIAGETRWKAAQRLGLEWVPVRLLDISDEDAHLLRMADNRLSEIAEWDDDVLGVVLRRLRDEHDMGLDELTLSGFTEDELSDLLGTDPTHDDTGQAGALAARFVVPPFSVLDARQGYWRDRKRAWLDMGLRSGEGRGKVQDHLASAYKAQTGKEAPTWVTTSVFDPVLCEIAIRWFSPPGGEVLDPFAGGAVRGVVAAALGRPYTGVDIRAEQLETNEAQWAAIGARIGEAASTGAPAGLSVEPASLTPVEITPGGVLLKRDDYCSVNGIRGGKVRSCWHLAQGAPGLITAGSRQSPQVAIVARVAHALDVPCRVHVPTGDNTPEILDAIAHGAEVRRHRPGHNSVIIARARTDAKETGWTEIPFGMETGAAVEQTAGQVAALVPHKDEIERVVVPVGSGMSLAGVLHGMDREGLDLPVLGVVVGADPSKRLDKYAPKGWRDRVTLERSPLDYHAHASPSDLEGIALDPVYEAKALPYLQAGDLLWVVGIRASAVPDSLAAGEPADPTWVQGDATKLDEALPADYRADLVFTCPPYADLEVYSEDPADLSVLAQEQGYEAFRGAYMDSVRQAVGRLRPDRFAVYVVGEVRRKDGTLAGMVQDTIAAAGEAGARLYNDAIFVTPAGTLPMRAAKTFKGGRKLGRCHQYMLVFWKGEGTAEPRVHMGEVEVSLEHVSSGDEEAE